MNQITDYLDPHTLAAISPLHLRARIIVEGVMTGMHRSPYLGTSVEFAQHRPYVPGDDLRRLDWKVFARTDKLHLKQYQQETNLDLFMLVDVSKSMAFGTKLSNGLAWKKYDHAASLTAALSYLALQQQDRVGLLTFASEVKGMLRPSNARDHWRSLIEALETSEPTWNPNDEKSREMQPDGIDTPEGVVRSDPDTDLARLFDQVTAKLTQRSLLILVSDLFDDLASLERGLARVSHRGHDLIIMQVMDAAELHFTFRDPHEFIGLENQTRLRLDPAALREAYLESVNAHLAKVESIARQFHFDYVLLDSSQSLTAPLSQYLARRASLLSKGK